MNNIVIFNNNKYVKKTYDDINKLFIDKLLVVNNDTNYNTEFNLGVYYHFIEKDYNIALQYYSIAANNNNLFACLYLSRLYYTIFESIEKANIYYKKLTNLSQFKKNIIEYSYNYGTIVYEECYFLQSFYKLNKFIDLLELL